MKMQTGIRLEVAVWQAYRALCSREHLRPSMPIEEFLKLTLEKDSALGFLILIRNATKTRVEGFDAYARVLLEWYKNGKRFFHTIGEDEAPVEGILLEALKAVSDQELRQRIEGTLIACNTKALP